MQRPQKNRIQLERFLPYRLSVLTNLVSGAIAGVYEERFELTIPEWRVLAVLARHPGLSAAEVATHTRMDAVAVSRAVSRLLKAGRLRRSIAPDDRRRSVLELSAAGESVYREIAPVALRYERALVACLDASELATLDATLEKLTARANALASARRGSRT
ncbi:MAG: MarR family transcriptional regulator [Gammaproteobacteria bacterium]|nr:MarR family transcriptional regulator [Gammaproteobacteria bacterium]